MKTYFGDVTSGYLQRLPFIGYFVLLYVLFFALVMAGVASLGIAENLVGGDLTQAQQMLAEKFGLPAMIIIGIVFAAVFFASLNLEAKRIRDMGLPGWWTLLAVWIISVVIIVILNVVTGSDPVISKSISSVISAIGFLALVLIPSNTFSGNNG
ncbi:MAG: DUF805 domain-containing protein [Pseudomonadota bacterium]|nr:DUF805 domain-containing protein [Pseudomonadota bacterium]